MTENNNEAFHDLEKVVDLLRKDVNILSQQNITLHRRTSQLHIQEAELQNKVQLLEEKLLDLNQYNRRENVEFRNVPENIRDDELEQFIISMLKCIDIHIQSYDIIGIHRLGNLRKIRPEVSSAVS